ncbi:MAG: hypothetical protein MI919_04380 [Holophagales bacterium]|nr:hypothetical protein [Holophagales bacterium]
MDELFDAVRADDLPVADVTDEKFWRRLQEQWGFGRVPEDRRFLPMNAANLCPGPTLLIESIGELREEYNLDVSQQKRMVDPETGEPGLRVRELRMARELVAAGLGLGDMDDIAIVRNASEGNNLINCGYRKWRRSDDPSEKENIIIWEENPLDPERSSGVVRVEAPRGNRSSNLYSWLYAAQNGYRIAGSGGDEDFRLGPHIYNTLADVERAVEGMNAWRDTRG